MTRKTADADNGDRGGISYAAIGRLIMRRFDRGDRDGGGDARL